MRIRIALMRPPSPPTAAPGQGRRWTAATLTLTTTLTATAALAAASHAAASESLFIAQILLLLLFGRLLGELMQRLGQPSVMGQLISGLVLGPSVFGALFPQAQHAIFPAGGEQKAMIDAVGQFGVLLLLLLAGMDVDLGLAKRAGRAALSVSLAGICVPFACGFALGELLPDAMLPRPDQRLVTALLLGTALSVSSVKIVAMVLREMRFSQRDIGQIILASAIIDDTIGWILIAVTLSIALHGAVALGSLAASIGGVALFLVVSFVVGRRLVFHLIRWTNDAFVSEVPVITAILLVMCVMALITDFIGVSTVLGAFVAGMLVGQSPILTKHIDDQLRGLIVALFMPVFFGLAGLNADLTILRHPEMLLTWLALVAVASLGKFLGAFMGGRLGGLSLRQCLAVACGMNARGSTEVIVATIGLAAGVLTHELFTMIVATAIVTTLVMPPSLRFALARLPMEEEERRRLSDQATDARGFAMNLERLLVAVDGSAKGKFAARLAGILAGSKGMPVTLLKLGQNFATDPQATVQDAADKVPKAPAEEEAVGRVYVTSQDAAPSEQGVAGAVRRGHDLLFIGVERIVGESGGFHEEVVRLARGFEGPLAVVSARGRHLAEPIEGPLDILVPMTGADASRRGAEVAFVLAQATQAPITILHVADPAATEAFRRGRLQQRNESVALRGEVEKLAARFRVTVKTVVRVNIAPEDAILRQARLGNHNLIVMGVSRRPGDSLSFGNVAAAILESAERSLLFVSTGA